MLRLFALILPLALCLPATATEAPGLPWTPAPINLIAFEVRGFDQGVSIFWQTAVEYQTDTWVLERSSNGRTWETVYDVRGAGNSTTIRDYFVVDPKPFTGQNFYRIRAVDYLGAELLTDYASVEYNGPYDAALFPNPVTGSEAYLRFYGFEGQQQMQVELMSQTGKLLSIQYFDMVAGMNKYTIDVPGFQSGLYFVRVRIDDVPAASYKLMVR